MSIHFMLVPDAQSGATLRDEFAKIGATNVKVGTFEILLDLLMEYWLLPDFDEKEWKTQLTHQAVLMKNAFWFKSIKVDEKSVIDDLETSLQLLLNTLSLETNTLSRIEKENTRYSRYYNDLCELHEKMKHIFPVSLTKARLWNENSHLKPLEKIYVYADSLLDLEVWQEEMIISLKPFNENEFSKIYTQAFIAQINTDKDDLRHLQSMLYSSKRSKSIPQIKNLQWLVARDVQQEVEVLAGMVQNTGAKFNEIAIVISNDGRYKEFLVQTFKTFNIPLSRAGEIEEYSDIGTQWVFDALQAQEVFAASMVFASLLSSPLMPFSNYQKQYLASIALDNRWRDHRGNIKESILKDLSNKAQGLVKIIIRWQEKAEEQRVDTFLEELEEVYSLISYRESTQLHKERFKSSVEDLKVYYESFPEANHRALLNQVQPYALQENSSRESYLNSIHIVHEDDCIIHKVKHLFVLGFNDGHYPRKLEKLGVFSHTNWQLLGKELHLDLDYQEQFYEKAKLAFKRQLQCAEESITFLSSALDMQGSSITSSGSLSDMAFCFYDGNGDFEPEDLLISLEKENEIPFFYATNDSVEIKEYRELSSEDLHFSQNIFELRKNSDGTLRPESPSSLEKLMISPLGWFLYRQGLEPQTWDVEELSVAIQGTIAHGVFEDIFSPENPRYDLSDIGTYIEKRIKEEAPFLTKEYRKLDYEQLKSSILKAADEFKSLLLNTNITVKSTEEQLSGEIFEMPVAGRTDAILKLGAVQFVVDYKRSGSSGRIKRMESGYDHQLFLYKVMLNDDRALTAYYTMNDATLVVDEDIALEDGKNYKIVGIENDCTANASATIEERVSQIINGKLILNCENDDKTWEKRGVTASYTLEGSPIVKLFMKPECEEV